MAEKKLNMKRVRDTTIWTLLISGILVLLFFSIQRKSKAKVTSLVVHIDALNGQDRFITESDIIRIIEKEAGRNINQADIRSLDIRHLEAKLNTDKRIGRADLYFDSNDRLNVKVSQKKPVLRVIDNVGAEYYLDDKGSQIPTTLGSAIRVPIVTGLNEVFDARFMDSEKESKLKEVFEIATHIAQDDFLKSLIEQIHVESNKDRDILLVPKIGKEKIIFGNANMIEDKFFNLKIFYKDGITKLGWSRYKTLNLKYSGQVRGELSNPEMAEKPIITLRDSLSSI